MARVRPQLADDPHAAAAALTERVRALGSETDRSGMARFGINVDNAFGVSVSALRELARPHRRDHALAEALWRTGFHETRILAVLVADPAQLTREQAERWAADLDSWDLTDQFSFSLADRSPIAWELVDDWADRPEEFVRRAAFATLAGLAVHDKTAPDDVYRARLPLIRAAAGDPRNFVKKAVDWALRQIGKRNEALHQAALAEAYGIRAAADDDAGPWAPPRSPEARAARWIAADTIRELESPKVRASVAERPLPRAGTRPAVRP